jgi:outer membrane protein
MGKKGFIVLIVLIVFGLSGITAMIWFKEKSKTVYILTDRVFAEYKGTNEVRKKIKATEEKQKSILDSLYMEIQTSQKAGKMAEEKMKKDQQIYQKLYSGFAASDEKQKQQYNAEIWKQINQYLEEYGKEKNYDYVLGASGNGNIMFANSTLNVTDEVIQYINKKYNGD